MREHSAILFLRGKRSASVTGVKLREKIMELPPNERHQPPLAGPTWVDMELRQRAEIREQALKRDFTAGPLSKRYLIGWIILIVLVVGGLALLGLFHLIYALLASKP